MVDAISQLLSVRIPKQNLDDTYFWIDILCVNQHDPSTPTDLGQVRVTPKLEHRV